MNHAGRWAAALCCAAATLYGAEWRQSFDGEPYACAMPADKAWALSDQLESTFADGVRGRALDLSSAAGKRRPVRIEPPFSCNRDFSVSLWVKSAPGAIQGTPIAANGTLRESGWQILTRENGSWAVKLRSGETSFEYAPPLRKINDGAWHQLAFTIDTGRGLARFYYDGRCVAIYNIDGLGPLDSGKWTVFGGSDDSFDSGDAGMIEAFNGCIDELYLSDTVRSDADLAAEFAALQPGRVRPVPVLKGDRVRCMVWNIWHGGRHTGRHVGPQRIVEIMKSIDPDVIGVIETYGSGAILADGMDYQLYLISSNLSILSRYPITEAIKIFKPFNSGAAAIDFGSGRSMVLNVSWLNYLPDFAAQIAEGKATPESLRAGEAATREPEIRQILEELKPFRDNAARVPLVVAGDFNVASHLDWTEENRDLHRGFAVDWPVSRRMEEAGFTDTFRALNPDVRRNEALSWCVWATVPGGRYQTYTLQARIDYIYLLGARAVESRYLGTHKALFPSDHGTFYTDFLLPDAPRP